VQMPAWHTAQSTVLSPFSRTIAAQEEEGIFSRYQGLEIPVKGSSSESFLISSSLCR
jgi:hypothetical protein